ncbi:hypothetical protein L249_7876 [Ophiocordyceps polyrhachis-furcata BCC 54312]|uniref:Uncharacterized protein n=1 Tax=Ophiocordyceps polyrhachis-furcata BCC 54312 TaxID=1330021 RepID=A0A367L0K4_9HYPO|nr:hypothetical protein L249_7876 [Ophiocordyceps polyrhachis-furcata BCC 54312]
MEHEPRNRGSIKEGKQWGDNDTVIANGFLLEPWQSWANDSYVSARSTRQSIAVEFLDDSQYQPALAAATLPTVTCLSRENKVHHTIHSEAGQEQKEGPNGPSLRVHGGRRLSSTHEQIRHTCRK